MASFWRPRLDNEKRDAQHSNIHANAANIANLNLVQRQQDIFYRPPVSRASIHRKKQKATFQNDYLYKTRESTYLRLTEVKPSGSTTEAAQKLNKRKHVILTKQKTRLT